MTRLGVGAAGILTLSLSGCVSVELTLPAADPDKHPKPKTQPSADTGVAYFRHAGRWHQMRVSMEVGGPTPIHKGHHVTISSDASLWRYNRRSGEYDIAAKFVKSDPNHVYYFARDEGDPSHLVAHNTSGDAGGGASGWRSRPYTEMALNVKSAPESAPRRVQTMSALAAARFYPNGHGGEAFRYEAKLEREWKVQPAAGGGLSITTADN